MFAKCLANDGLTDWLADAHPPQQASNNPDMLKDGDNLSGTMGLQVAGPGTQSAGKINSIILGGPADIEGTLREDDVLIAIDGEEVGDKNFVEKIRGTDLLGSRNVITIDRQGELIHVSLTRTSAAHVSALSTTFNYLNNLKSLAMTGLHGSQTNDAEEERMLTQIECLWDHLRETERRRLWYEEQLALRVRAAVATSSSVQDGTNPGHAAEIQAMAEANLVKLNKCLTLLQQASKQNSLLELENRELKEAVNTCDRTLAMERVERSREAKVVEQYRDQVSAMESRLQELATASSRFRDQEDDKVSELKATLQSLQNQFDKRETEFQAQELERMEKIKHVSVLFENECLLRAQVEAQRVELLSKQEADKVQLEEALKQLQKAEEREKDMQKAIEQEQVRHSLLFADKIAKAREDATKELDAREQVLLADIAEIHSARRDDQVAIQMLSRRLTELSNATMSMVQLIQWLRDVVEARENGSDKSVEDENFHIEKERLMQDAKLLLFSLGQRCTIPSFSSTSSIMADAAKCEKRTVAPLSRLESSELAVPGTGDVGIGVTLQRRPKEEEAWEYFVFQLTKGGPAAGTNLVQEGDVIVSVDGRSIESLEFSAVRALILGAPDTLVDLILRRPSTIPPSSKVSVSPIAAARTGAGSAFTDYFVSLRRQCL